MQGSAAVIFQPATALVGIRAYRITIITGEVSERPKEPDSKSGVGATPPWVRIPPSPLVDYEIGLCFHEAEPNPIAWVKLGSSHAFSNVWGSSYAGFSR